MGLIILIAVLVGLFVIIFGDAIGYGKACAVAILLLIIADFICLGGVVTCMLIDKITGEL